MAHLQPRRLVSCIALMTLVSGCAKSAGGKTQGEPVPAPAGDKVTAEDVQRAPNVPIEQLLQSKVPGIVVTRTDDGNIAIRIRGTSSFSGNNFPLYVVDGIVVASGPGGSLPGINPYDIASIKVLKEATDITMYGSRGANGVIVIKTKQAH
ncbi:MAG: TonB-dependent outer membrane protein SusC/RagA, conserved site [Gemmatimonadetes bacterium]|nr:TonB-dependent outer membrane protein SusC/RagA, conserved site [Gemmatimonadota bacterium]